MSSRDPWPGSEQAPVDPGDTYFLQIEELGQEGDGIGYVEGFVIIVSGAGLGDRVPVKIDEVYDTFALASMSDEPEPPAFKS